MTSSSILKLSNGRIEDELSPYIDELDNSDSYKSTLKDYVQFMGNFEAFSYEEILQKVDDYTKQAALIESEDERLGLIEMFMLSKVILQSTWETIETDASNGRLSGVPGDCPEAQREFWNDVAAGAIIGGIGLGVSTAWTWAGFGAAATLPAGVPWAGAIVGGVAGFITGFVGGAITGGVATYIARKNFPSSGMVNCDQSPDQVSFWVPNSCETNDIKCARITNGTYVVDGNSRFVFQIWGG